MRGVKACKCYQKGEEKNTVLSHSCKEALFLVLVFVQNLLPIDSMVYIESLKKARRIERKRERERVETLCIFDVT
ncbi:hypothetical protein RchiOBHm_Chr6g0254851 [Rosa chinensis]|uniref:Uncharacterized protein n=1 Tax=Rosa chinensis TaxID=74649 RepID=A0A2P6PLQ2_ROSCH|nr:hypothetical protein RchiOBHm_Chr6g0254851 [Rosa chinensis]